MAKAGRKSNRERALALVAKHSADKKAVKIRAGVSLENAETNASEKAKRFQKNLK